MIDFGARGQLQRNHDTSAFACSSMYISMAFWKGVEDSLADRIIRWRFGWQMMRRTGGSW